MNAMSSNTAYFILEWLVNISVILWVLECIVSLLNDIISLKNCEPFFVKMVLFLEFTCIFALWYSDLFGVMWIPCYIIRLNWNYMKVDSMD